MMKKIILVSLFLLLSSSAFAAQLIDENFDDNDFTDSGLSDYSGGGPVISTDVARSGSYSVKFDGSQTIEGLWWPCDIDDNGGIVYIKYYVYYPEGHWDFEAISTTGLKQNRFYYPGGNDNSWMIKNQYSLGTDPGTIQTHTGDTIWSSPYGIPNVTTLNTKNTWHKIETYLYYDYDGVSHITVWFNDSQVWDSDGDFDGAGFSAGNLWAVQIAAGNGFGTAGYYYVDDLEVWNELPTTSPVFSDASVNSDSLTINFYSTVVTTGYDSGDCAVTGSTTGAQNITALSGSGSSRTATLGTPIVYGETVTLSCTLGADDIESSTGADMVSFGPESVSNLTPQGSNVVSIGVPLCLQ